MSSRSKRLVKLALNLQETKQPNVLQPSESSSLLSPQKFPMNEHEIDCSEILSVSYIQNSQQPFVTNNLVDSPIAEFSEYQEVSVIYEEILNQIPLDLNDAENTIIQSSSCTNISVLPEDCQIPSLVNFQSSDTIILSLDEPVRYYVTDKGTEIMSECPISDHVDIEINNDILCCVPDANLIHHSSTDASEQRSKKIVDYDSSSSEDVQVRSGLGLS